MAHREISANSFTNIECTPTLNFLFLTGFQPMFQNVRHCEQNQWFASDSI